MKSAMGSGGSKGRRLG